jgi:HK97 gp10 family phage protein
MELQHIKGLSELSAALKELPNRIARNALRQSVARGAVVIRDEAKTRAPVSTTPPAPGDPLPGTLKRSIVIKHDKDRSSLTSQTYVVAVRHGKKYRNQGKKGNRSQDAYYWRWVEFGTVKMAARPFMRPAFEAQKEAAVQEITRVLAERIAQEAQTLPGAKR